MLIIKSRERENKMNVRVIKDADGVAQNMVASLGVTGLSFPADIFCLFWAQNLLSVFFLFN